MKQYIALGAAGVAVVAGGVLFGSAAARHYNQYQTKLTHTAQVAEQKAQDDRKAIQAQLAKVQAAYDNERVQCEKGQAAYALLSPFNQKKTQPPVCGTAVIK